MSLNVPVETVQEPTQLVLELWTAEDDTEYQAWLDSLEVTPSER